MRKILVLLSLMFFVFVLNGCSNEHIKTDLENSEIKSKEIIKCFDNRDTETLKKMFCKKTQSEHNLDKEIQEAFDLYEGQSTSYDTFFGGTSGENKYGEWLVKKQNQILET